LNGFIVDQTTDIRICPDGFNPVSPHCKRARPWRAIVQSDEIPARDNEISSKGHKAMRPF